MKRLTEHEVEEMRRLNRGREWTLQRLAARYGVSADGPGSMLVLTTLRITPCSHFREPSDNFGNSIGRTSTFPGPTYTTPRLLAINVRSFKNLECFGSGFSDGVILLSGTAHSHTV